MIRLDAGKTLNTAFAYDTIIGWLPSPAVAELTATLGGIPIRLSRIERRDIAPGAVAFCAYFDVRLHGVNGAGGPLALRFFADGKLYAETAISFTPPQSTSSIWDAKAAKREWIGRHLRYGVKPRQDGSVAINLLPDESQFTGRLEDKRDRVSAHGYPERLKTILAAGIAAKPDFMALDFGAGLKREERANVIYMEVFDYPSVDVLSEGQALPFADASFDMVITLAVLEHVDDPFACASEMLRVLKPGGILFSGLPFMQPEHGYPAHYFNATRHGHRRLFGDAIEVIDHIVDGHQHPMFALQWILRSYRQGLRGPARQAFEAMTVRDLIAVSMAARRKAGDPLMELTEDVMWRFASATTIVGKRR